MKRHPTYNHFGQVVIRTPRYSEDTLTARVFRKKNFLTDHNFLNLIRLASSDLFAASEAIKSGKEPKEKVNESLLKYFTRSCCRCTPFGGFACLSIIDIPGDNHIEPIRLGVPYLHIDFSHRIYESLEKELQDCSTYLTNDTLYEVGSSFRFWEPDNQHGFNNFALREIDKTGILNSVIQFSRLYPRSIQQLEHHLSSEWDITAEQALSYIRKLIEKNILIRANKVNSVVDNEKNIIVNSSIIANKINFDVYSFIGDHSENDFFEKVEKFRQSSSDNNILHRSQPLHHVIKADSFKPVEDGKFPETIVDDIIEAIPVFQKLTYPQVDPLSFFKMEFNKRFESQRVSILRVFDPDLGLNSFQTDPIAESWPNRITRNSTSPSTIRLSQQALFLHKKLIDNLGQNQIQLHWDEIKGLPDIANNLSPSISAFGKIILTGNQFVVGSLGFWGPSSIKPIGRFSYNKPLSKLINEVAKAESSVFPDLLAEIDCIPIAKVADIGERSKFRENKISILAPSDSLCNLPLSDLSVFIDNGKAQLYSERLKCTVLPVLSNAHNFSTSSFGIYKFLCQLIEQYYTSSIHFSWHGMENLFSHLPRICFKNIILNKEKWILESPKNNTTRKSTNFISIREWKEANHLPNLIFLVQGDNKLFVDFNNPDLVDCFISTCPPKGKIYLEEYIPCGSAVTDREGAPYSNEFIIPLIRKDYD